MAPVGYLDGLAAESGVGNVEFTVVGYGLQSVKPVESGIKQRRVGTVSLVNLGSSLTDGWNIHYSNNPGEGHGGSGGTCFGDSGGPVIHEGVIVAVNSFVLNENCQGAGFGYRVDTQYAQDFIPDPTPKGKELSASHALDPVGMAPHPASRSAPGPRIDGDR